MNIGLVGWNGKCNVGDDAMTSVLISYLSRKYTGASFHLLANESKLAVYTRQAGISIRGYRNIDRLRAIPLVRRYAMQRYYAPDFARNKDLILFGGGSLFHSAGVSANYLEIVRQARQQNSAVKIGAVGVSIGPFKQQAEYEAALAVFQRLDFIVVRDTRSYKLLQEMQVGIPFAQAPDLALLLPGLRREELGFDPDEFLPAVRKTFGVSLRSGRTTPAQIRFIADIATQIFRNHPDWNMKYFNFSNLTDVDASLYYELIAEIPAEFHSRIRTVGYSSDPLDFYREIRACGIMFCIRLHAAVIAYAVQTNFFVIPYHQKNTDFAEDVGTPLNFIIRQGTYLEEVMETVGSIIAGGGKEQFVKRAEVLQAAAGHFQFL